METPKETVTLEEILDLKFKQFYNDVIEIVGSNMLPFVKPEQDENLEYLEMIDLLIFLFPDQNTLYNINEVLDLKCITTITDEQKNKLVPIIDTFMLFCNKVKALV